MEWADKTLERIFVELSDYRNAISRGRRVSAGLPSEVLHLDEALLQIEVASDYIIQRRETEKAA